MYSDETESEEEQYYESDNEDDNEIMCTNMDPQLAKLLGITLDTEESQEESQTKWTPPSTFGLSNSNRIINDRSNEIFEEIKTCVLMKQSLNDEQLDYIKHIDKDKLYEIIFIYNNSVNNNK